MTTERTIPTAPSSSAVARPTSDASRPSGYRTIWRWHFYAGLFCIPFVLWLSITGSIYLFHPQLDALFERPYNHVSATAGRQPASAQVEAALATMPGAVLNAYQLADGPHAAAQILIGKGKALRRVFVDPSNDRIVHQVQEDHRFTRRIFHLHGELLMGAFGSALVELAACWAIVMLLTGLYLWWPRGRHVAGVLFPRLHRRGRTFWRDIHAVTGMWVSIFALLLILTGLPWATFWGGQLKDIRHWAAGHTVQQDWTTGRASELALRRAANTPARHAWPSAGTGTSPDYTPLNRMLAPVRALHLAPPVLITPPSARSPHWAARSDAPDRPLRVNLQLDPSTGQVVQRTNFDQRPLLDRIVGYGIAVHEGQLFGPLNQLLGVLTALGLITLSLSALVLWWRRRPPGALGAPAPTQRHVPWGLLLPLAMLVIYLPLLGISAALIWLLERLVLSRIPWTRRFLGLALPPSQSPDMRPGHTRG